MGLFLTQIVEPRLVARKILVRERSLQNAVIDLVQFEFKEDEVGRNPRQGVRNVAVEFGARRIALVLRVVETRVRAELAHRVRQSLVVLHSHRELPAIIGKTGELTLIGGLHPFGFPGARVDIRFHLRGSRAGIQIGEVPLRHGAEFGALLGCGSGGG